LYVLTN